MPKNLFERSAAAATVVMSPFANERVREWPIRHYRRFIDRVILEEGAQVVLVGTPAQRPRANEIVRGFPAPAVQNACGKTSWHELASIVEMAAYVVANNSGIAHLAAARNCWTLCVFAASHSPIEWMPLGPRVVVVSKALPCAPCEVGSGACPNRLACMQDLDPDAVYDLFQDIRRGREASPDPQPAPRR
jgi:heptosyltransferase-2